MKRSTLAFLAACLGVAVIAADATDAYAYRGRTVSAYRGPHGGVAVRSRTAYYGGGRYYRGGAAAAGLAVGTAAGVAAANRYNYNCSYYYPYHC